VGWTGLCQGTLVITWDMNRVGQNHIYTVHIRYFWQGNHQIYGHIRCIYTVLANPRHEPKEYLVIHIYIYIYIYRPVHCTVFGTDMDMDAYISMYILYIGMYLCMYI